MGFSALCQFPSRVPRTCSAASNGGVGMEGGGLAKSFIHLSICRCNVLGDWASDGARKVDSKPVSCHWVRHRTAFASEYAVHLEINAVGSKPWLLVNP